jgi:hypothetical protein
MENARLRFAIVLAAATLAPAAGSAAVTVNVEGPDQLLLVGPAHTGNTNINRSKLVPREVAPGRLTQLLAPAITSAIEECKATDVTAVTLRASGAPDRIGGTTTRYGGLGIYVNLPSTDRNSDGTWYIAPFFAFEGEVSTGSGSREPIELFGVTKMNLTPGTLGTTQEDFFRSDAAAVEASLSKYIPAALPKAVQKALGAHCQIHP